MKKTYLKKINELKKYFSSINKDENYKVSLDNLANSKKVIFEFFDNVKVNDQEENIKKTDWNFCKCYVEHSIIT